MTRAGIAGLTDYSNQLFEDMVPDLEEWVKELEDVQKTFRINIRQLKESKYWDKVDVDFQWLLDYAIKFHDTSINEISRILDEIQAEVSPDHVTRIRRLGKTAADLNVRYGKVWHQGYRNKEYGNEDFKLVEELYAEGRNVAVGMLDLSNLAERLEDFVGTGLNRSKKDTSTGARHMGKSLTKTNYILIIPGKAYAPKAHKAHGYKKTINRIAAKSIPRPLEGRIDLRLEYLFRETMNRLDGDNLLKTFCDALKGVAYTDDDQVYHHEVTLHNMNSSFTVRGIPLNEQVAECLSKEDAFTIVRIHMMDDK